LGVSLSPSRSGSSPIPNSNVLTAACISASETGGAAWVGRAAIAWLAVSFWEEIKAVICLKNRVRVTKRREIQEIELALPNQFNWDSKEPTVDKYQPG
jgi:hypothetical protein